MEALIIFIVLAGLAVVALPAIIMINHGAKLRALQASVNKLATRLTTLEGGGLQRPGATAASAATEPSPIIPASTSVPPPASVSGSSAMAAILKTGAPESTAAPPAPVPSQAPGGRAPAPPFIARGEVNGAIDWEAFFGVKLFAWMGGLTLFVGVLLAIRYAFENNLITPGMRVAGGAVVGVALIAGGLFAATRRFRAPAFSMCATGVLVLYGDIYAAHAYYNLVPMWLATVLMAAVSAGAFLLAIRLDAQVIVVLGILGGFLTPPLVSTGVNKPLQLFGYATLLNLGVAAVAIRKRWNSLVLLAALGTVATEFGWLEQFFDPATASISRFVFLFFGLQFLLICFARQRLEPSENWSALGAGVALNAGILAAFTFVYATDARVHTAGFIFPFVFFCNAGVIALAIGRQFARGGISRDGIAAVALAVTWALEWSWQGERFSTASAFTPLLWYVAIFTLFAAYPYFSGPTAKWPWTIAAVAGPVQFWLVYRVCAAAYPTGAKGLIPLAFAVPFLAGVWFLHRRRGVPLNSPDERIASQAGAALLFISLVFPVQFRGEWITIGWAMEGLALLLLYRLMPNRRLQVTAVIVLCAAFVRLALNPAVFEYHPRSSVPLWNWYLYAYGVTTVCLLASGRCLRGLAGEMWVRGASGLLYTLGVITAFLLLNIEIADYFSIGPTLTFSFSGNFARDMTYSIAWALFAFALLLMGMRGKAKAVRYAGLTLLIVTLLKLFLHDLGNLNQLYRIGAFIGVALILIVASFVYQRFLRPTEREQSAGSQ